MIPKPKHTPMSQHGWEQLRFRRRLDIWVSSFLPGWLIGLVVALFFSTIITSGIMSVIAFAAWDLSWYGSVTSRALFGGITALFCLVIWSNS